MGQQHPQKQVTMSSNASVSSASSVSSSTGGLSVSHPIVARRRELLASLDSKKNLASALEREMKEISLALANIEQQVASPTVSRPDVAKTCVFVGPKKTGKYRQLHINELDQLYYFTDGTVKSNPKKTLITDPDRAIYQNSEIRLAGHSIWDGPKIARHLADMDENPEDLEESFGIESSFEEDDEEEAPGGGGAVKANPLNLDLSA